MSLKLYSQSILVKVVLYIISFLNGFSCSNEIYKETLKLNQTDTNFNWTFYNCTFSVFCGDYDGESSESIGSESNSSEKEENWLDQINRNNLKHSMIYTVIMIVLYSLVFLVGIVGNIAVIAVIGLRSRMRTVTNLFILNLAVADGFVLLFCLPATLLASIIKPWILGPSMCWGVTYVQGVSVLASAYTLVAISMDRCNAICHNPLSIDGFSHNQALLVIVLIWIISVSVPLPWTYVFELQMSETDGQIYCTENWEDASMDKFYFIFANLCCCYILPFILITVANLVIWWKVAHRNVPQTTELITEIHKKTKRGVGKMLGFVTLIFLLSWLPLYVMAAIVKLSDSIGETGKKVLSVLVPIAQWLGYWNSCVNPVFYAFLNSNFRKMSKSLLPPWILDKVCASFEGTHSQGRTATRLRLRTIGQNNCQVQHRVLSNYSPNNTGGMSNGNNYRSNFRSNQNSGNLRLVVYDHEIRSIGNNKCAIKRVKSVGSYSRKITAV